jgi:hypothetical protein
MLLSQDASQLGRLLVARHAITRQDSRELQTGLLAQLLG